MKLYKTPTKTLVVLDHEKMVEDLKLGPVYLSKEDYPAYKALTMYMRNRDMGNLRPAAKTITYLYKGEEVEVIRVSLTDKPVAPYAYRNCPKVVRVADGVVFDSLNKALQATDMPKGAKYFATVKSRIDAGKSIFEASCGVFKEVV